MPAAPVVRHPPERGRSSHLYLGVVAGCSCSCSCSCCCLHTVGAVLGAFVGGGLRRPPEDPGLSHLRGVPVLGWIAGHLPRLQGLFWGSVFWVLVAGFIAMGVWDPDLPVVEWREDYQISLLVFGAIPLLAGWLLCLIRLACLPSDTVTPREWRRLAWILIGIVAGDLLGDALMLLWGEPPTSSFWNSWAWPLWRLVADPLGL